MGLLILFLPFLLMILLWRRRVGTWPDTFLIASIVWCTTLVVMTEFLSLFNLITYPGVLIGWIVATIILLAITPFIPIFPKPLDDNEKQKSKTPYLLLLPQLIPLAALLALVAFIGPPNNWDSMSYHLTRIIHWMQNRNVDFYPTYVLREWELGPAAEFIILHLQILAGNDRFSNLVQWFAYIGCAIGVSRIAQLLGASPRGQLFAATAAATLPMAAMQAVATQNDLVAAFWLVTFAWILLRIWKIPSPSPAASRFQFILAGLTLGLGLLTKSTLYLYFSPFILALAALLLSRLKLKSLIPLASIALLAILINLPMFIRNEKFSHTPLGNGGMQTRGFYTNAHPGPGPMISNALRNTALELTFIRPSYRHALESFVLESHRALGLDPQDPNTLWLDEHFSLTNVVWSEEDSASNPFHFILILAAIFTLAISLRRPNRAPLLSALAILFAFLLFCAYLRWQPWHSRLLLPLLIMSTPFLGYVMDRHWNPRLSLTIATLLPLSVLPWLLNNPNHPLHGPNNIFTTSREPRYFLSRPFLAPQNFAIADYAAQHNIRQVGLIRTVDAWEYPLDMLLRTRNPNILIVAYPAPGIFYPDPTHTQNPGWDDSLQPHILVRLSDSPPELIQEIPAPK